LLAASVILEISLFCIDWVRLAEVAVEKTEKKCHGE